MTLLNGMSCDFIELYHSLLFSLYWPAYKGEDAC